MGLGLGLGLGLGRSDALSTMSGAALHAAGHQSGTAAAGDALSSLTRQELERLWYNRMLQQKKGTPIALVRDKLLTNDREIVLIVAAVD